MQRDYVLKILVSHFDQLRSFGVRSLAVFGSVARNEAVAKSDVDLLVDFSRPVGIFEFVALKEYLEGVLGCQVDLVTSAALKPPMREQVLGEAVYAA